MRVCRRLEPARPPFGILPVSAVMSVKSCSWTLFTSTRMASCTAVGTMLRPSNRDVRHVMRLVFYILLILVSATAIINLNM